MPAAAACHKLLAAAAAASVCRQPQAPPPQTEARHAPCLPLVAFLSSLATVRFPPRRRLPAVMSPMRWLPSGRRQMSASHAVVTAAAAVARARLPLLSLPPEGNAVSSFLLQAPSLFLKHVMLPAFTGGEVFAVARCRLKELRGGCHACRCLPFLAIFLPKSQRLSFFFFCLPQSHREGSQPPACRPRKACLPEIATASLLSVMRQRASPPPPPS